MRLLPVAKILFMRSLRASRTGKPDSVPGRRPPLSGFEIRGMLPDAGGTAFRDATGALDGADACGIMAV